MQKAHIRAHACLILDVSPFLTRKVIKNEATYNVNVAGITFPCKTQAVAYTYQLKNTDEEQSSATA